MSRGVKSNNGLFDRQQGNQAQKLLCTLGSSRVHMSAFHKADWGGDTQPGKLVPVKIEAAAEGGSPRLPDG